MFKASSHSKEAWALSPELSRGFNDWLSRGVRCESLDELRHACPDPKEVDDAVAGGMFLICFASCPFLTLKRHVHDLSKRQ